MGEAREDTFLSRQPVFSRFRGYKDMNDAARLFVDSATPHVLEGRARRRTAASTSQMGRFENEVLTQSRPY